MITKLMQLALIAASLVCACGTVQAQSERWRHGVVEPKGDGGFSLMVGQHDFASKRGLMLDIVIVKNGTTALKALLAGELESIEASPGVAILAGARGADVKIIGCNLPGLPHVVMTRAGIASAKDLKGKTIAVAAPGSLPNLLMNAILERYHIPAADVNFANLGGDHDRYKAVLAGVADAGVVASEFISVAPADMKVLVAARDVLPNYLRVCLITTGKVLQTRAEDTIRFMAAEMDSLRYALTHREETIKFTLEIIHAKPDDPRPAYAYDEAVQHDAIDAEISLPMEKLQWMQEVLLKTGNLKQPIDLHKIVNSEVRALAAKHVKK